jgi:hypothetical protein
VFCLAPRSTFGGIFIIVCEANGRAGIELLVEPGPNRFGVINAFTNAAQRMAPSSGLKWSGSRGNCWKLLYISSLAFTGKQAFAFFLCTPARIKSELQFNPETKGTRENSIRAAPCIQPLRAGRDIDLSAGFLCRGSPTNCLQGALYRC